MVGKKSPQLFIFIIQFLRGFITATKLMLTLELMQQDAKWFQLPWSLCKNKNWPCGRGEGDWCESFNFRFGVSCSRERAALQCFVPAPHFTFAAACPDLGAGLAGGMLAWQCGLGLPAPRSPASFYKGSLSIMSLMRAAFKLPMMKSRSTG